LAHASLNAYLRVRPFLGTPVRTATLYCSGTPLHPISVEAFAMLGCSPLHIARGLGSTGCLDHCVVRKSRPYSALHLTLPRTGCIELHLVCSCFSPGDAGAGSTRRGMPDIRPGDQCLKNSLELTKGLSPRNSFVAVLCMGPSRSSGRIRRRFTPHSDTSVAMQLEPGRSLALPCQKRRRPGIFTC
jgi:hypothetical protein